MLFGKQKKEVLMTMKNGSMRKRIVNAMIADVDAMPGRAGETPISCLANMLSKLKDSHARKATEAITGLVNGPPSPLPVPNPEKIWRDICFLANYPKGDRSSIKEAFFARLFGPTSLDRDLRSIALMGYLESGGMLTESHLRALWFIRDETPILWLGAAVSSGFFVLAKRETLRLLKEGKVWSKIGDRRVEALIISLDSWKKSWPSDENFFDIVKEFHNAAPDLETKEKLRKWADNRKVSLASVRV